MSRSKRKPYIKDKPRNHKRTTLYWSRIRSVIKNKLRSSNLEDVVLPNPREIINDYDYCDYSFLSEDDKHTRK